jgi:hypothetical protein
MAIFKTFKAKIYGATWISTGNEIPVQQVLKFSKRKILLTDDQIKRGYFDPLLVQDIAHKTEYIFDKTLNKEDEKKFAIILKQKLNALDNGIHFLDINWFNKIKANIIHNRYWIDKEKEWFVKTLLAAFVGAAFALIGGFLGYKLGFQNGKAIKSESQQSPSLPNKR